LVLLISGPVFKYADEVAEDVLLLVDLAHMRDLRGRNSLQEEHFLVGDV